MRNWKICNKCLHCRYVGHTNIHQQLLYECKVATSEEEDGSYCCRDSWGYNS